jgi:hypothetical protein
MVIQPDQMKTTARPARYGLIVFMDGKQYSVLFMPASLSPPQPGDSAKQLLYSAPHEELIK